MKVGWRFCGQPSPLETPINTGGMARLVKGEGWMHWFIFMGIIKQIIGKKESIYYHLEQGYYSLWANVINLTGVRLITLAMWYIGPEEPVPLTQWLKCLIRTRVRNLSLFQMNEICHLVQRCPPIHNLCNTFINMVDISMTPFCTMDNLYLRWRLGEGSAGNLHLSKPR